MAGGRRGKDLLRHGSQQVRFALARGQQEAHQLVRYGVHRHIRRVQVGYIDAAIDGGTVVQAQRPGLRTHPQEAIA
jgi:hypothetical protein